MEHEKWGHVTERVPPVRWRGRAGDGEGARPWGGRGQGARLRARVSVQTLSGRQEGDLRSHGLHHSEPAPLCSLMWMKFFRDSAT